MRKYRKFILSFFLFIIFFYSDTYSQENMWQNVEKVIGKEGSVQGETEKFTFPRYDLDIKIGDVTLEPGFALTSWVIFIKTQNDYMIMGDMVLKESEVPEVMNKIVANELNVTALHNHIINESPKVMYLHFSSHGDAVVLARRIRTVLETTSTPFSPAPLKKISEKTDWSAVESILGYSGKSSGSVIQFSIPRQDAVTDMAIALPPQAGMTISINFQAAAGRKAAITGDFILTAEEVNPVVKVLTENNILVTAIHNHMLFESPKLYFLHFWAIDNADRLAEGLHLALEKVNVQKSKQ